MAADNRISSPTWKRWGKLPLSLKIIFVRFNLFLSVVQTVSEQSGREKLSNKFKKLASLFRLLTEFSESQEKLTYSSDADWEHLNLNSRSKKVSERDQVNSVLKTPWQE